MLAGGSGSNARSVKAGLQGGAGGGEEGGVGGGGRGKRRRRGAVGSSRVQKGVVATGQIHTTHTHTHTHTHTNTHIGRISCVYINIYGCIYIEINIWAIYGLYIERDKYMGYSIYIYRYI